jgi:hypothetical protein
MSVLHDPRLTAYDRCVYAELALWVAEGNVVKVGTRKIASALGFERKTVMASLESLRRHGKILIESRRSYQLLSNVFGRKQGNLDVVRFGSGGATKLLVSLQKKAWKLSGCVGPLQSVSQKRSPYTRKYRPFPADHGVLRTTPDDLQRPFHEVARLSLLGRPPLGSGFRGTLWSVLKSLSHKALAFVQLSLSDYAVCRRGTDTQFRGDLAHAPTLSMQLLSLHSIQNQTRAAQVLCPALPSQPGDGRRCSFGPSDAFLLGDYSQYRQDGISEDPTW